MSTAPIVVGVDGSDTADAALQWAARTAAAHTAPLHLVAALPTPVVYGGALVASQQFYDDLDAEANRTLTAAAARAREIAPGVEVGTALHHGPPIPALLDRSESARMLVVGSRGLGAVRGALVGSVSTALATHSRCPVVVIPTADPTPTGPVVVGVDGSPNSAPAIGAAFLEASLRTVPLVAVHAWSDVDFDTLPSAVEDLPWEGLIENEEATLAECLAGWRERFPDVEVQRIVVRDRAVDQLLTQSRSAQLVVVGSHGRGGFRGMLLGSTSRALLHRVERPVMIVRERR
ncbi:universal stress protein [Rhodococcus sp. NPDC058505]|uniref:universal stress protein n=1 Tax=Rhodococcus sp. NPDC058505 TaxID=3346531 RepID=UPI003660C66F